MADSFNLQRFLDAQAREYSRALREIQNGRKVKACMTLFWVASENELFKAVLDAFYGGEMDSKTMKKCGNTTTSFIPATGTRNTPLSEEGLI